MNATDNSDWIMSRIIMPRIDEMRIVDGQHRLIEVRWLAGKRRGRTEKVDLSPMIDQFKIYRPLREDSKAFETAHLVEGGFAIAWLDGSIDMSAESVERLAEEMMTGAMFAEFLARNSLTHQGAAAALGCSKRTIENYLKDDVLPRTISLACTGYEARRKAFDVEQALGDLFDSLNKINEAASLEPRDPFVPPVRRRAVG